MTGILYAVAIYVIVFGIDYLFYMKQKIPYEYVSRRTYLLFIGGQIIIFTLFYNQFATHTNFLLTELVFVSIFAGLLLLFARQLIKDRVYVCSTAIERTNRCLTPYYVWVKGAEIMFQQMVYMVIAHQLVAVVGLSLFTYLVFPVLLLLTHSIITLSCTKPIQKRLTVGVLVLSVPILYIFTTLDLLWPAVYLHGILYVVYWLAYADFDIPALDTPKSECVNNRG